MYCIYFRILLYESTFVCTYCTCTVGLQRLFSYESISKVQLRSCTRTRTVHSYHTYDITAVLPLMTNTGFLHFTYNGLDRVLRKGEVEMGPVILSANDLERMMKPVRYS